MYKTFTNNNIGRWKSIAFKILLIMRLTIVLIFLSLLQVSAASFGQKVTLKENAITFKQIFSELKNQTGYTVIYYVNNIDDHKTINVNFKDAPLEDVLKEILAGQSVTFTIKDKAIVLKEEKKSLIDKILNVFAQIDVRGRVLDPEGNPLVGATITIKGSSRRPVLSGNDGNFMITNVEENSSLVVSYVGYELKEIKAVAELRDVTLMPSTGKLEEVNVVSTGYQTLPKERSTGSFVQLDNELLNRRVSTNILDRLEGISPGLFRLQMPKANPTSSTLLSGRRTGILIRGKSTINGSTEPLIVVDNFPYEGEISNINPNDIESVTILKDAAAASIWGARAGNGVIVINTKKGKLNQQLKIDFNSNVTIIDKPDLSYAIGYLDSKNYIEIEQYLFDQGYYNTRLVNNTSFPGITPAVELMEKYKKATSDQQRSQIQMQIDQLKSIDVRNDYNQYVYQKAVNQQYSLGIQGGGHNMSYALSVGHDNNVDNLINNGYNRTSIRTLNTYRPVKKLELTAGLTYSQSKTLLNNNFGYGDYGQYANTYNGLYPYAMLADENGNPLSTMKSLRNSYIESTQTNGFLDWNYRPIDEINSSDNTTKVTNQLFQFGARYEIFSTLNFNVNYQNERQLVSGRNLQNENTFYTRDLINKFSVYNSESGSITNNFPRGGILNLNNADWNTNNLRAQLNYDKSFKDHSIIAIAGAEIRENKYTAYERISYGYNDQFGTAETNLNFTTPFPMNPSGSSLIPSISSNVSGQLNRYVSQYANIAYAYKDKYVFNMSVRQDGANLYGAKTNDKFAPLWSAGMAWNISKEPFYRFDLIPELKIRGTYGFNGNTFLGSSAYLIGAYFPNFITGAKTITNINAPNPRFRWEKVRNINMAVDFVSENHILTGTIEFYHKNGNELVQPTPLAPQTGFETYQANTASTKTKGLDLTLQSQNLKGRFNWNSTFLFSTLKDKVTKLDLVRIASNTSAPGNIVGKSQYALYSYKWAGLNPINGNPRGFLNGQISENYTGIINNFSPDSLVYSGSSLPTIYGALRNDFSFKGFSLSVNIVYQLKYVFRKLSTNLAYTDIIAGGQSADYANRWQKSGDESITNIPSIIYPSNFNRNSFYQNSEVLIQPGDVIRLQDIKLGYQLSSLCLKKIGVTNLNFYSYANNLGIIWRKNKLGIDPAATGRYSLPAPLSFSFGINANF